VSEHASTGGWRARLLRAGTALAAGGVLALAFPGIDFGSTLWLWMPLLVGALDIGRDAENPRVLGSFGIGWLAGFAFHFTTLRWLSDIWSAGPFLSVLGWLLLSSYLACYFGVWAVIVRYIARLDVRLLTPKVVGSGSQNVTISATLGWMPDWLASSLHVLRCATLAAAAWVALEWLRGFLLSGFSWNGLAMGMHQNATLIQAADLVGANGLSFVPVFFGYVLYATLRRVHLEIAHSRWRPHPDLGVAVMLVAGCFLYGVKQLSIEREELPVDVALMQPMMSQEEKHNPQTAPQQAAKILAQLERAIGEREDINRKALEAAMDSGQEIVLESSSVDLLVLPESVLPWGLMYQETFDFAGGLQQRVGSGTDVVFGTLVEVIDVENPRSYNSIAVFESGLDYLNIGEWPLQYHKVRLVPFGEYLPFREIGFIDALVGAAVPADFDVGESTEPLQVETHGKRYQLAPLLCFEDTVAHHVRQFIRKGEPQLLVNVTNDGWFDHPAATLQHTACAMFRCIELRRPMVRSANTGVTCIIDETGSLYDRRKGGRIQRVQNESGTSTQVPGVLFGTAYLPVHGDLTVYAAFGDWFAKLCGLLVLVSAAIITARKFMSQSR